MIAVQGTRAASRSRLATLTGSGSASSAAFSLHGQVLSDKTVGGGDGTFHPVLRESGVGRHGSCTQLDDDIQHSSEECASGTIQHGGCYLLFGTRQDSIKVEIQDVHVAHVAGMLWDHNILHDSSSNVMLQPCQDTFDPRGSSTPDRSLQQKDGSIS